MFDFRLETYPLYYWDDGYYHQRNQVFIEFTFPKIDLGIDHWRWVKRAWTSGQYNTFETPPYDEHYTLDDIPF